MTTIIVQCQKRVCLLCSFQDVSDHCFLFFSLILFTILIHFIFSSFCMLRYLKQVTHGFLLLLLLLICPVSVLSPSLLSLFKAASVLHDFLFFFLLRIQILFFVFFLSWIIMVIKKNKNLSNRYSLKCRKNKLKA